MTFPTEYVITGDAKNNDFFMATQKYLATYAQTVNMNELMSKMKKPSLKEWKKFRQILIKILMKMLRNLVLTMKW
jgi:hypothetical protein